MLNTIVENTTLVEWFCAIITRIATRFEQNTFVLFGGVTSEKGKHAGQVDGSKVFGVQLKMGLVIVKMVANKRSTNILPKE